MRRALADFGDRAAQAEVAVIYFAGHGVEVARQNYLIPVDAALADTHDLPFEAVRLGLFRRAAERASRLSLVIVDACRNNPFLAQMQGENRALSRGLARVREGGDNELVAFAAREGTLAADGEGENSPYAAALAEALVEPGLEIGKLFRRVRDRVRTLTGGAQEPALYGSLSERNFYFLPPETPAPDAAAPPQGTPAPPPPATRQMIELTFWQTIAESEDPRDFEEYLRRFPEGVFAGLARRRIERLDASAVQEATASPPGPGAGTTGTGPAKPAAGTKTGARTGAASGDNSVTPTTEQDRGAAVDRVGAPDPGARVPKFRPTRRQIRDARARLNILGHEAGREDGLMGQQTAAAIARFRAARGIPGGQSLTPGLLDRLAEAVPPTRLAAHRRPTPKSAYTDILGTACLIETNEPVEISNWCTQVYLDGKKLAASGNLWP